jgi:hypothetical protein
MVGIGITKETTKRILVVVVSRRHKGNGPLVQRSISATVCHPMSKENTLTTNYDVMKLGAYEVPIYKACLRFVIGCIVWDKMKHVKIEIFVYLCCYF